MKQKIEKYTPKEGDTLGATEGNESGADLVVVQGDLFEEVDKEEQIELHRSLALGNVFILLDAYIKLREELEFATPHFSPILKQTYSIEGISETIAHLAEIRQRLLEPDEEFYREDKRDWYLSWLKDVLKETHRGIDAYNALEERKNRDYRIEVDPLTGEKKVLQFKSGNVSLTTDPLTGIGRQGSRISSAWEEIQTIAKRPRPSNIRMPKDLMESQIRSVGDTLEYITDPKKKQDILREQAKGNLLAGTLEGLSGGSAYLKSFTIALAQILNEQSKYYKTEEDYSGVPQALINDMFGDAVEVKTQTTLPAKVQRGQTSTIEKETRKYPYILVSYDDTATKMRGKGRKKGGKDSEYIREYIGKLSGKQYLLDGGVDKQGRQIIVGIPFLVREAFIYRGGKEVGCLLRLSPQFSKTLRGYTSLRADTIQLLGGGNQKDITMALLDLLLYVRGAGGSLTWKKNKQDLLSMVGGGKTYSGRPGKRETDFQNAVKKIKDTELIIGYREETAPSGDVVSVFKFNPDYTKEGRRQDIEEEAVLTH